MATTFGLPDGQPSRFEQSTAKFAQPGPKPVPTVSTGKPSPAAGRGKGGILASCSNHPILCGAEMGKTATSLLENTTSSKLIGAAAGTTIGAMAALAALKKQGAPSQQPLSTPTSSSTSQAPSAGWPQIPQIPFSNLPDTQQQRPPQLAQSPKPSPRPPSEDPRPLPPPPVGPLRPPPDTQYDNEDDCEKNPDLPKCKCKITHIRHQPDRKIPPVDKQDYRVDLHHTCADASGNMYGGMDTIVKAPVAGKRSYDVFSIRETPYLICEMKTTWNKSPFDDLQTIQKIKNWMNRNREQFEKQKEIANECGLHYCIIVNQAWLAHVVRIMDSTLDVRVNTACTMPEAWYGFSVPPDWSFHDMPTD